MISLNEIPYDWLKPGVYAEVRPAYDRVGLSPWPARALLMVQMLPAGTATPGQLYRITRPEQGTSLFGAGSVGEAMARAFKRANRTTDVHAIALADAAAGVQAAGSFTFSGPATAAGVVALHVADHRVVVPVAAGDTAAAIATAAAAALAAVPDLAVTATAAAGVVTVTARHKGECGNALHLAVSPRIDDTMPAGIGCVVTAMAGGAGNPTVTTLLDAIAGEWFTDIVCPWTDATNLGVLAADLGARYAAMGRKDAHAYAGGRGTFGQLAALGDVTSSPHLSVIGAKGSASPPWAWAAALAGVAASQLADDPARQLRGLALPGIAAPAPADRFDETEQDLLLRAGISTVTIDADGTVRLDRVVTTHGAAGDTARPWLDITIPKTLSRIRWDWASYVSQLYPRHKLADDGSPAAVATAAVVTPRRMHGSWAARCQLYEREGWIEGAAETVAQASFERDTGDRNRMNARQPLRIIGNLMVLASALEFQV
ncbi:phage tail protein [Rhodoplanes serenus]|uniref:Phage tail protein n=1 Tax=Rhodoplanes serenus TaxID=200615 RepID=A0A9X4XUC9_9BRAD|nr:phage tail sheath subtilisin-like domain-containing protein [Rhodoplanes serenus]MTW19091.1 phage tail protein [Rhodoplanes serenus]